jgi:hypothetical protein
LLQGLLSPGGTRCRDHSRGREGRPENAETSPIHVGDSLASDPGERWWASASSADLVRRYGADEVIDYRTQPFEAVVTDMDVVLDTLGGDTLNRSFAVLRPGGCLVSLSGIPDRHFGEVMHLGTLKTLLLTLYGAGVHRRATKHHVTYVFLFMRASG